MEPQFVSSLLLYREKTEACERRHAARRDFLSLKIRNQDQQQPPTFRNVLFLAESNVIMSQTGEDFQY